MILGELQEDLNEGERGEGKREMRKSVWEGEKGVLHDLLELQVSAEYAYFIHFGFGDGTKSVELTYLLQGGLREAVLLQVKALFNCVRMHVH